MSKAPSQAGSSSAAANLGPSSSSSCSSPSAGGTTSPANVLHAQPEKPQHYTYVTKHLYTHLITHANHIYFMHQLFYTPLMSFYGGDELDQELCFIEA